MTSETTRIDGIPMRWEEQGEGPPVVLIHGIPTCPALWRHVVPRVSGARCMAWEMVGYGASIPEGRKRDISVARQADYLASWIRHLGLERPVLAGHDLGGGVAQILAVRYPDLCGGLFLTNSIGYDSWPILGVKLARAMGPFLRFWPDTAFKQFLRVFIHGGHEGRDLAEEAVRAHWPHYRRHGGAAAFVRQINSLDAKDTLAIAGELRNVDVPARIVWGAADIFQKIHYGERLARDLDAPLRRIEGGLHFTPEDHPDIVAEEIQQLIARPGARQSAHR